MAAVTSARTAQPYPGSSRAAVDQLDLEIAMVFQSYALYPHTTAREDMAFALRTAGVGRGEVGRRVEDAARVLDLTDYLDRKTRALSGGQRQRVAMGRAIVRNPQVSLMDEPLSNLDAKLRVQTRTEIAALQQVGTARDLYDEPTDEFGGPGGQRQSNCAVGGPGAGPRHGPTRRGTAPDRRPRPGALLRRSVRPPCWLKERV